MKTLVIICLMVSVFTFSEACSCIGGHPQRQFCDADFVIRARILGRTLTGGPTLQGVYYTVMIRQYYKREPRTGRRIQRIYTALHGTSCGVSFRIGREYIIAGFIQNNRRWSAQLCSWNVETTSLTPFQRKALRNGFYRNNCFCEIFDCTWLTDLDTFRCPSSTRNRCVVRRNSHCFRKNNACINNGRGCRWQTSSCTSFGELVSRNALAGPSLQ
ncbi:metalloproteinase inhibitor 3-like [Magallana gigas]|uniref:metalloproteinase inhibitor 3-like n=1 Tax=Magallana gigas TaxID=29159 RepID=UPI00148AABD3|nr:metalloproteinase inhibitor 3-like [Crassostrea gigas]